MWYNQQNYPNVPVDVRSLVIANSNLLQRFNITVDPNELYARYISENEEIDIWSVAEYVDGVHISQHIDNATTWPTTNLSVVKFRRMDQTVGGFVDHYCLTEDFEKHMIVDSLDGVLKDASIYGDPQAWAEYVPANPADDEIIAIKPDKTVCVVQPNENFWDACRRVNQSVDVMREYNDIDEPRDIVPGDVLRIPPSDREERKKIRYEFLDSPVVMHVAHPGGTTKYSFGDATRWDHVTPTSRFYKFGVNLNIAAIAHVELDEENTTAAYYMEALDVGDYPQTGRVQFTIGFNHSHLQEGHMIATRNEPSTEEKTVIENVPVVIEQPPTQTKPSITRDEEWKRTHKPLNGQRHPILYLALTDVTVRDMDGKRQTKILSNNTGVLIYSTFEKDDVLYGRPIQAVEAANWYGIPMDKLIQEDELYNDARTIAEKQADRSTLSGREQLIVFIAKPLARLNKIKTQFIKK